MRPGLPPQLLLPAMLAFGAAGSILGLWLLAMPSLDDGTAKLQTHRQELKQRQQAAAQHIYQPLIGRLQQPLPEPAAFIAMLEKQAAALGLDNLTYTLALPKDLDFGGLRLQQRKVSLSVSKADPAAALMLWQELRAILPCELRLAGLSAESSTRLELELIGTR